jgi:hypothetical protein
MATTGIKGFDRIINNLKRGDNVVWQIDSIEDYREFVKPFVDKAVENGKRVVYIRFTDHDPVITSNGSVKVYALRAEGGFESFSSDLHWIIAREGEGVYYVFDCLSFLLSAWATDLMIGNFFRVTCPYLFELGTIAYFSILRNRHSFKTIARIRETTQLLIDVYNYKGTFCVHPLKVWNRYSPTMFLPHLREGEDFVPITDSVDAAQLFSEVSDSGVEDSKRYLDHWDRLFLEAEGMMKSSSRAEIEKMVETLSRIMVTKDEKMLELVVEKFNLQDLLNIKSRLIGTGFIGGKTTGMLMARKILSEDTCFNWAEYSEAHDSFYIGSDVFYTFIVENGWWKLRLEQKTEEGYFDAAARLKEKMLTGKFPEQVLEQFRQIIEYFGQSPIIVRSSSLLEDAFGNAFAGKYESYFLVNQGTPEERFAGFTETVRKIYSSTMGEDALTYRLQRGLHESDEQMALLVQRVSGSYKGNYYYPDAAGVGISYNPYVWTKKINPQAGMIRLVYGLGTRAVNRIEGDYARIVALDQPLLRPVTDKREIREFSQHNVDLLDIKDNKFKTVTFRDLVKEVSAARTAKFSIIDYEATNWLKERNRQEEIRVLTFDEFVSKGDFTPVISKVMSVLKSNYKYPVDIEFTVNFKKNGKFTLNLVQCRPLQTRGLGEKVNIPQTIDRKNILFKSDGYFLGGNISQPIHQIIYVDPRGYIGLPIAEKYSIARIVGQINKKIKGKDNLPTLLLGPGRWGTTTPSLGVPVAFAEISNIAVLGEIAFPEGNLMPDLSFGTHFFQDLVETDIFYVALFPDKKTVFFNTGWLDALADVFEKEMYDYAKYKGIIRLYDVRKKNLRIMSDILSQKVRCFFL